MVENHRRETLLTVANLFSVTMNLEILLLFKNMKDVMISSVSTEKTRISFDVAKQNKTFCNFGLNETRWLHKLTWFIAAVLTPIARLKSVTYLFYPIASYFTIILFGFLFYQNADSGLCVAMGRDQGQDLLKQEICDVKSDEQKFTCKGNTVTPEKDSGLCVTASGKLFS